MAGGKTYKLSNGRPLWVGPGSAGEVFFTYTTGRSGHGEQRYITNALPPRKTLEEAQNDLDAYAREYNLEPDRLVKLKRFDPDPAA